MPAADNDTADQLISMIAGCSKTLDLDLTNRWHIYMEGNLKCIEVLPEDYNLIKIEMQPQKVLRQLTH